MAVKAWQHLWPRSAPALGIMYLGLASLMGLVGGALAILIRTQLSAASGQEIMLPETYLAVVTMHGSVMVFGVVMPALFGGVGALALPSLLGRERLRGHGMQLAAFWLLVLALGMLLASFLLESGPAASGWGSLLPLAALEVWPWDGQDLWILAMGLVCLSNFTLALVYARNTFRCKAARSILVHAYSLSAWVALAVIPWMLVGLLALASDRHLGSSYFMPGSMVLNDEVLAHTGGLPRLFRALFWYLGHPNMLLLLLPALGIAFEIAAGARTTASAGYRPGSWTLWCLVGGSLACFVLGLREAWSSPYAAGAPSPAALVMGGALLATGIELGLVLLRSKGPLNLAKHFIVALVVAILAASVGSIWLALQISSERLHGSYFAVGHLHLLLGLVSLLALFAALHHWFPAIFGRRMDEGLGKIHFWLTSGSMLALFLLMQFQGLSGLLRRYWQHAHYAFAAEGQALAPVITALTYLAAGAQVLFLFNFLSSIWLGTKIDPSPNFSRD